MEKHAPDPMTEPGGLRCDPDWTGSGANAVSEIEVDELNEGDEWNNFSAGNANTEGWERVFLKSKKKKRRQSEEGKRKEVK